MFEAVFIFISVVWTFFGAVVLYNVPDRDFKPSFRLALVVGPYISITGIMIVLISIIVEKVVAWVNKN